MKSPDETVGLPLDYATELAVELHLMRAECCDAAQLLVGETESDAIALEECAILDEALARSHALIQRAVTKIRALRVARGGARQ